MKTSKELSIQSLRQFEPLTTLSEERLLELVSLSNHEKYNIGTSLFNEGDIDSQTLYLLHGDVQLGSSDGQLEKIISADSDEARYPLDDSQPRQLSCIAMSIVEVLRIDNSVLDYMMAWDQLALSEDKETGRETEKSHVIESEYLPRNKKSWKRNINHIMSFRSIPPANINLMLEKMEACELSKGDTVITQGETGDYYYVLASGQARVTRTIELAMLDAGSSFGEEALVTGGKRNASVTMCSDGTVMRLAKSDFDLLLKEPMLERINADEARRRVNQQSVWLDIRHAREFHSSHIPQAVNIPLHELRMRLQELNRDTHYICYCRSSKRSSAAAFLLTQNGYQASVLSGGMQTMAGDIFRFRPSLAKTD